MWVHLIDADSKIPNLALMKISAYYKAHGAFVTISKGDTLAFSKRFPDRIYISIIYKKNGHMFDGLISRYHDTVFDIGGSGYDLKKELPLEIECMKPDYDLYPKNDYSINFSSRGCIRNTKTCPWCIVPIKEGKYRRTQHPKHWYNLNFDKIVFLDNNILADKEWFMQITDWCISKDLKVWFTQGLDIRLMDEEIARRLLIMKTHKMISFSWDRSEYEPIIREKIELLKSVGFSKNKLREKVQFYVYIDNDSDYEYESGVYRCRTLKELGCNAFAMYNIDNKRPQRVKDLQRWSIRKIFYWLNDISDYKANIQLAKSMKKFHRMSDGISFTTVE